MSEIYTSHPSPFARPLEGRIALVTGAARNLGAGFVEGLAQAGAVTIIHYNSPSSETEAKHLLKTVTQTGGKGMVVQSDLTSCEEIKLLFDTIEKEQGGVDIVVNNAGRMHKAPVSDTLESEFNEVFALNTKAAFFVMKEAGNRIRAGGSIINIGTSLLSAFTGHYAAYAGSKAPLEDFTRALAKEIGHRGVAVNTICPGPVETSFLTSAETPETLNWLAQASVSGRLGQIEDIVPWVVFLATPASTWATGQTFFVNGGFTAR
ncbi:SDR family oxidoreductase [Kiloniella sp. EL199]|uniref:SDR family oxidoreductase n=1 Tax=Kiloniella sp. EL199 TaxID=2107581 RepID=UPI000EA3EA44|nr:SDR family oxidoreductase [Kiloniella sp. EL199]